MSSLLEGMSSMRRRACMLSSCWEHSWFLVNILELDAREMLDTEKHRDGAARCHRNWRRNLDGGSGGREKQLWGTEGETLSMSSATGKKEKESKTQESRGFQSVVRKEYLECLLVASLQMEHAPLMPSLLRPFWPSITLASEKEPSSSLSRLLPCGCQLSSSVLPLLLRQNMTLWSLPSGPLSAFCLRKNFSQRISLNVFCFFSLTTCSTCNGSAEF